MEREKKTLLCLFVAPLADFTYLNDFLYDFHLRDNKKE